MCLLNAKGEVKVILPVFMDNCTFATNSLQLLDNVVAELSRLFRLCDLKPTITFLGIKITMNHPNCYLMLSQHQYILDMLECYEQTDLTTVKIPMVSSTNLSDSIALVLTKEKEYIKKVPHIPAVSSLLFLVLVTCLDIVFVMCYFNSNPGIAH